MHLESACPKVSFSQSASLILGTQISAGKGGLYLTYLQLSAILSPNILGSFNFIENSVHGQFVIFVMIRVNINSDLERQAQFERNEEKITKSQMKRQ